jgi:DNA topoisomerase-1
MGKSLVIVESPAKAKKIQTYLGSDYIVKASVGHIRDLPKRELGVDLTTLKPTYVISEGKEKVVSGLRQATKSCDHVFIATDLDREGEAIGWHLLALLKPASYSRAVFNEITKSAIQKAIANAGPIDMQMVAAQETRRVIDRLVGYQVSPALTKAAASPNALSAGRVQSVALRIIVDNDTEITSFKPESHYKVLAHFEGEKSWSAEWDFKPLLGDDKNIDVEDELALESNGKIWRNKEKAQALAKSIDDNPLFTVNDISKTQSKSSAPCPFTTSLLQQAASNSLGFSTSQTMQYAQKLFEEGLITYHRTDNQNLSETSLQEAREWITKWQKSKNYPNLVPAKPNKFKNKADAQEAHEAIRPTSFDNMGGDISDDNQQKLYRLIWRRAIASQMIPAEYDVTKVSLMSEATLDGQQQEFEAKGRIQTEAGWRRLTGSDQSDDDDKNKNTNQLLPPIDANGKYTATKSDLKPLETKPSARLTEATLVKTLEKKGVGRPSTFASIIAVLLKRSYVTVEKRKFYPSKLGRQICKGLVGNFSFLEIPFTSDTEKRLDLIAQGKAKYKDVVASIQSKLIEELGLFVSSGVTINTGVKTYDCPSCNGGKLVRRTRKGKKEGFYACNNFPECRNTYPEKSGKPDFDWTPPTASEHDCPKCKDHKLILREGKFGDFYACESKGCNHMMNSDNGKPVEKPIKKVSEFDCPKCKKNKLILRGNGDFFGCSGFPKCKKTCKVEDGMPVYS